MSEEMQTATENQNANPGSPYNDLKLDDIGFSKDSSGFDNSKYEGFRIKIQTVEIIDDVNWYNKPDPNNEGKFVYNKDSTEMMKKVLVKTYPLPVLDEENRLTDKFVQLGDENKLIEVKQKFNLKKNKVTGEWEIPRGPHAKLWNFMKKLKAEKLTDLKDQYVTLTVVPDNNDEEKSFIRIVC